MGVQDTSSEVYYNEVKPNLNTKQRTVFIALQMSKRPVCNQELSDYLQQPINTITPRVNELVVMGKVEEAFRDIFPQTGRRVIYWQTTARPKAVPPTPEPPAKKPKYEEYIDEHGEKVMRIA